MLKPMPQFHSYNPAEGHRLPDDPLKAIVAPRPIGWIGSVDKHGHKNLAPYSFFNMISTKPPLVMFASEGKKDSLYNIQQTQVFTCNLATQPLAQAMSQTSAVVGQEVDEFVMAELETAASDLINAPRVAASPASFECRLVEVKQLQDMAGKLIDSHMVIGQIVRVHIDNRCLVDGRFELSLAQTIARAGYRGDYVKANQVFEILRPKSR